MSRAGGMGRGAVGALAARLGGGAEPGEWVGEGMRWGPAVVVCAPQPGGCLGRLRLLRVLLIGLPWVCFHTPVPQRHRGAPQGSRPPQMAKCGYSGQMAPPWSLGMWGNVGCQDPHGGEAVV